MSVVSDASQKASVSAFSQGTHQVLKDTVVLNAGGNITYLEMNLPDYSQLNEIDEAGSITRSMLSMLAKFFSTSWRSRNPSTQTSPSNSQSEPQPPPKSPSYSGSSHLFTAKTSEETVANQAGTREHITMISSHNPEFITPRAQLQLPLSCEVYVDKMFAQRHGYPLWYPQLDHNLPHDYREKGLYIGDVGFITDIGAFDLLFNVWASIRNPVDLDCLPDDFDSISPPKFDKLSYQTQSACNTGGVYSSIADLNGVVDLENMEISYTIESGDQCAILSLPDGASNINYKNVRQLQDFITRNAESWYRYALWQCGRDIDRHSLYFVTGCLKSKSWGIAIYNSVVPQRQDSLVLCKSPTSNGPAYVWKKPGRSESRTGPEPDSTTSTETRLPETENQCLFFRGFKISLSEQAWNELNPDVSTVFDWDVGWPDELYEVSEAAYYEAATSHKEDAEREDVECALESYEGSGASQRADSSDDEDAQSHKFHTIPELIESPHMGLNPVGAHISHPLNFLNDILLSQVSGSRAVVTHDDQLWEISQYIEEMGNHQYDIENVERAIKAQYVIGYNEETKTCTLKWRSEDTKY